MVVFNICLEILGSHHIYYSFILHISLRCQQKSVNCPLSWMMLKPQGQIVKCVMAGGRIHRREFPPRTPRKRRHWREERDLRAISETTEVLRFEREGPFCTKRSFWHEVGPKSQTRNNRYFFSSLEIKKPCRVFTHRCLIFGTSKITWISFA